MRVTVIQTETAVAVVIERHGQRLAIAKTPYGYTATLPQSPPVTRSTLAEALQTIRRENMFTAVRP